MSFYIKLPCINNGGWNRKFLAHLFYQELVYNGKMLVFFKTGIKRIYPFHCPGKITGFAIINFEALQVLVHPKVIFDLSFVDRLEPSAFRSNRNGQPLGTCWGLNFVPVSPISCSILTIVIEYKNIGPSDDVEISLPGDIAGL